MQYSNRLANLLMASTSTGMSLVSLAKASLLRVMVVVAVMVGLLPSHGIN